jgi:hypothetical protein
VKRNALLAMASAGILALATQFFTVTATPSQTPTPTLTPVFSPTPTPTSERPPPAPPVLISPQDRAVLPQPVPPGEWVFQWSYPGGPAVWFYRVVITGPGDRQVMADVRGTEYHYTSTEHIPEEASGPWYWSVIAYGLGAYPKSTSSETRQFWVMPTPTETPTPTHTPTRTPTRRRIHLPVIARGWSK